MRSLLRGLVTMWNFLAVILACALAGGVAAQSSADVRLIEAAERGDLKQVRELLAAGANVRSRDAQARTALVAATYGNQPAVARVLIDAGADVNAQDNLKNSAFLLAGARGHLEILRMTLTAGADLKSTNRFGGTALIPACHYGHVETVRELLKTKVDVNHVNNLGWTALLEAVILGDGGPTHTEIVQLLLQSKARTDIADRDGISAWVHARRRGYDQIARLIERAGGK